VTSAQAEVSERPRPAVVTEPARQVAPVSAVAANPPAGGSQSPPGWVDPYSARG
jgi:hypothetical protein